MPPPDILKQPPPTTPKTPSKLFQGSYPTSSPLKPPSTNTPSKFIVNQWWKLRSRSRTNEAAASSSSKKSKKKRGTPTLSKLRSWRRSLSVPGRGRSRTRKTSERSTDQRSRSAPRVTWHQQQQQHPQQRGSLKPSSSASYVAPGVVQRRTFPHRSILKDANRNSIVGWQANIYWDNMGAPLAYMDE